MDVDLQITGATLGDVVELKLLYEQVALRSGGIIRQPSEITDEYIANFVEKSLDSGLIFLARNGNKIIGDIHAYQYGLNAHRHTLTDLTIAVHPDYQGNGVGKQLFEKFLQIIREDFGHILRVELFVRERNTKAVLFYQKLGFVEEGRLKNAIRNTDGSHETPIAMTWFNPSYREQGVS